MAEPHTPEAQNPALTEDRAVVFADVAGSTGLYESAGDEAAKALVVAIQTEVSNVVRSMGGAVQKIVADDVVFHFDDVDQAVACACEVHRAIESFAAAEGVNAAVRIGLHFGPVIIEEGRLFGDTVNTAARVSAIARAGQIITTDEVVSRLTDLSNAVVRRFDEVKVKGKREALVVYEVLWRQTNVTQFSRVDSRSPEPLSTLELEYRQQSRRVHAWQGSFSIGRSTTNELVVDAGSVSRQHATIDYDRGRFVLVDTSTNGTYVQTNDGPVVFYRRERIPLVGRGQIGLGAPPSPGADHVVSFDCG